MNVKPGMLAAAVAGSVASSHHHLHQTPTKKVT